MNSLMSNIIPILFLILFGFILRLINYFKEDTIKGLIHIVAHLLIPCVIFTTFMNLDIQVSHLWIAGSFMLYQFILLAVGWIIYKAFRIKRRFFPFIHCAFAFGFMAVPLFSTVFGEEHMDTLVAMGVGHELFVGLVYVTVAQLYLKNASINPKAVVKSLASPLFIMTLLALIIKFGGLTHIVLGNVITKGLVDAIAKLAGLTSALTMLIVGYRIRFSNRAHMLESAGLVATRYAITFGVGYLFKWLVMDRIVGDNIYFDYAFFTLLSQHGPVLLITYVGEYGTQEDIEVASNAFVINALVGIAMYIIFVFNIG